MADNKLELVVTIEVGRANQSIKSVNTSLSSIEQTAAKNARAASQGIDGMTASMLKGATAGNLIADAVRKAVECTKSRTIPGRLAKASRRSVTPCPGERGR